VISSGRTISKGIVHKNIGKDSWEVRKGLKLRILFCWQANHVEFILVNFSA
jgi:hypothetical protein